MNAQIRAVVRECTEASDQERIAFPDVIAKLMQAGIERYHADLTRAEKTFYLPNGSSETVTGARISVAPSREFSAPEVEAAIRAIQAGRIKYKEFCARIVAAGCVGYFVSLAGRRAIYYGRTGDSYVEPFPSAA